MPESGNADLNTAVAMMLWRHDYGTEREPDQDRSAEEEFNTSHLPLACRIVDLIRPVASP